jgi:hypothetical protein
MQSAMGRVIQKTVLRAPIVMLHAEFCSVVIPVDSSPFICPIAFAWLMKLMWPRQASGRRKTCSHQNDIVWTLFDPLSTTFIHFWVILISWRVKNLKSSLWFERIADPKSSSNDPVFNLLLHYRSKWFKKE